MTRADYGFRWSQFSFPFGVAKKVSCNRDARRFERGRQIRLYSMCQWYKDAEYRMNCEKDLPEDNAEIAFNHNPAAPACKTIWSFG